jgi:hypothetical protein
VIRSGEPSPGIELRWVEFAEALRATETVLLHMLGLLRGVDPEIPTTVELSLPAPDAADVLSLSAELVDLADQLRLASDALAASEIRFRHDELQRQAAAVVAGGVADPRRLLTLVRCLDVATGFAALSESLRCTEAHLSWDQLHIGDVIGSFRDVDRSLASSLTSAACLSPAIPLPSLSRQQLTRIAAVLEAHAADKPYRPHEPGAHDDEE